MRTQRAMSSWCQDTDQQAGIISVDVVVRDDSPIRRIQDLKGKTFAFGDKQRFCSVRWWWVRHAAENLGDYKFIGHYDNIAKGVANGDFEPAFSRHDSP